MKAEVAHFTTEQMVDMVGLLSPCMDDYLYVCDLRKIITRFHRMR